LRDLYYGFQDPSNSPEYISIALFAETLENQHSIIP
jgi:hypothetical protein